MLEGDLRQPGCGLSKADLHRAQGATAVIHAAASVTFTAHVFESLADNYHVRSLGTFLCVQLVADPYRAHHDAGKVTIPG